MPVLDTEVIFGLNPHDKHHTSTLKIIDELSKKEQEILAPDTSIYEFQFVLRILNRRLSEVKLALASLKQIFEENRIKEARTLGIGTILLQCEFEEKYSLSYFDSLIAASAFVLDRVIISGDRAFDKVPGLARIPIR
ncbi:MAG: type II toxin-antitoxin system VapC family toxin [Nitrososphaerales archaeon]